MELGYRAVDADNHYYETLDACTRHLPKEFKQRGVQVVQQGTHSLLLVGGKLFKFIPNPTFDPIIVAGCMDLMFRGQIPEGVDPRSLMKLEPLRAEYQDRDARLAFNQWLDEDWGFAYQDRIHGVPMLSLADPDAAIAELDWVLERGARMVH